MTTPLQRSHVAAIAVLAIVALLGVLLLRDLGGELPVLPRFVPPTATGVVGPTNDRLMQLFAPEALAAVRPKGNLPAPFFTSFFQPPLPPTPPKENVKKTRKVGLTYSGFYETHAGDKRVYLVVDGKLSLLAMGAPVISDLMISNIQRLQLTLVRGGTQEVAVPFRGSTEVEVPAE